MERNLILIRGHIVASPWVPVYDIAGNFAGSKFSGTGNFQNP